MATLSNPSSEMLLLTCLIDVHRDLINCNNVQSFYGVVVPERYHSMSNGTLKQHGDFYGRNNNSFILPLFMYMFIQSGAQ